MTNELANLQHLLQRMFARRGVGHSELLLLHGVVGTPGSAVVCLNSKDAERIRRDLEENNIHQSDTVVVPIGNLDKLAGSDRAVFIDHAALMQMVASAARDMDKLQWEKIHFENKYERERRAHEKLRTVVEDLMKQIHG